MFVVPYSGLCRGALEVGVRVLGLLVEADAVLVDVVEDGDEHAQAGKHQQGEGPDGLEAKVPVEQATSANEGQNRSHEQTETAVVGVDGVIAKKAQEGERHNEADDAADEEGCLIELLFHFVGFLDLCLISADKARANRMQWSLLQLLRCSRVSHFSNAKLRLTCGKMSVNFAKGVSFSVGISVIFRN